MRPNGEFEQGSQPAPAATEQEDRRLSGQRHAVSAVVQIVELSSGARLNSRLSDLGTGGCYIDTMTPLPLGSELRLGVVKDKKVIEVNGSVIYSHPGLGMGISFANATPEQRAEINMWVGELSRKNQDAVTLESMPDQPSEIAAGYKVLLKLIHLLIAKGVLAEDEAREILNKPIF